MAIHERGRNQEDGEEVEMIKKEEPLPDRLHLRVPECPKCGFRGGRHDTICPDYQPENSKEWVNHPQHYGGDTTYEVIKVLEAWGILDFCLGNAIKYIARNGKKETANSLEDLKKAQWYLNRKIEQLEKEK